MGLKPSKRVHLTSVQVLRASRGSKTSFCFIRHPTVQSGLLSCILEASYLGSTQRTVFVIPKRVIVKFPNPNNERGRRYFYLKDESTI